MTVADPTLNDLIAACTAQPESRTPMAILADYLEEQGDPRCELLRTYLDLWRQAEELPTEGKKTTTDLDLSLFKNHERRLRHFACLCVRLTPLPDGRRSWELLKEEQAYRTIVMAELFNAELATPGELQHQRLPAIAARGQWMTLAARHAAWTAKKPEQILRSAGQAANCVYLAAFALIDANATKEERFAARQAIVTWQQRLAKLCAG